MTQRYGLPNGGFIELDDGEEGPRHDPYSYREITVQRHANRLPVTIHIGLGTWATVGNGKILRVDDPDLAFTVFAQFAKFTPRQIERFCYRCEARREERMFRETGMTMADIRDAERAAGWSDRP